VGEFIVRDIRIAALTAACLLAGCAASGVQASEQQAQSFQVGRSTYSDVVKLEHVSTELNRGDSQESVDARV
jgi:hypothetical protein